LTRSEQPLLALTDVADVCFKKRIRNFKKEYAAHDMSPVTAAPGEGLEK